ncbi:GRZ1 protein, partial [Polypterus senegalus]
MSREAMLGVYWTAITVVFIGIAGVSGSKIIDGYEATPHSRPYMVHLKYTKGNKMFNCGAFLITENVLLTAAHCLGERMTAILGSHNLNNYEASRQEIAVSWMIPHELYDRRNNQNDIMLLQVSIPSNIEMLAEPHLLICLNILVDFATSLIKLRIIVRLQKQYIRANSRQRLRAEGRGTSGIKIIHGNEAKPHSRPYMAALYVGEEKRFICGGFLVKPRYILTAAHCNLGKITAHLGVHNRTKKERTQQVIPVKEIIPHEQFNARINANDIMLLKLQRKARVTRAVNTISILKSSASIRQDASCFVAGWGHTGSRGPSSDVLREVEVKISQTCKTQTQICAKGTGLKGACVSAEKIIDGKEAIPHSRPYMAFLKIKRGEHFYSCGGFIIHRKFILSAAHCSGEHITALLGAHNRIEREKSWQEIPVQKIIVHEKYNKILENDIMLLKLQHKAIWTREVQRIKIPNTSVDIRPNTSCSVLGWGKTNNNGSSSDVLREVEVKVQDVCNCKAARKFNLTATAICARGTGIKGVCNLERSVTLTPEVQLIRLPLKDPFIQPSANCSVAGWGTTKTRGKQSSVLRKVNVKIQDVNDCKAAKRKNLTETVTCARGTGIKGTCNGDSGGPLVCSVNGRKPKAVGIVSFHLANSKRCKDPNRDNIYTKVSVFRDWIDRNIKANSPA